MWGWPDAPEALRLRPETLSWDWEWDQHPVPRGKPRDEVAPTDWLVFLPWSHLKRGSQKCHMLILVTQIVHVLGSPAEQYLSGSRTPWEQPWPRACVNISLFPQFSSKFFCLLNPITRTQMLWRAEMKKQRRKFCGFNFSVYADIDGSLLAPWLPGVVSSVFTWDSGLAES